MLVDIHTHTSYSFDADHGTVEENVLSAIEKGISVLGITEHMDFFRRAKTVTADVSAEREDILRCREKYGDRIRILAGVELGEPHSNPEEVKAFLESHTLDYQIGSVHALGTDLDLYYTDFARVDCNEILNEYFDETEKMIRFGHFHTLGHMDYSTRYMDQAPSHPTLNDWMDRVDIVLRMLMERGIALESNAKGLTTWQKEPGPGSCVLTRYRELGGELITVGSDSHDPSTIGRGVPEAMENLRAHGFRYVTIFENGQPEMLPL